MTNNRDNNDQAAQTQNHRSLAENIGISETQEDFGGGRGQNAGAQESVSSQDQFDNDVVQLLDENDFEGTITPSEPVDYYDKKEDREKA
jgi:hypothetical protein